jgi:hypothetical protein
MKQFILMCALAFMCCTGQVEVIPEEKAILHPTVTLQCIEGHLYYYISGNGLAPKLNDDGTPCKCKLEK